MRRRKSDLHARVNRNLPLEFDDVRLTSYAGLELLERYLRTRRFNQLVREAFADLPRGGDFGVVVMVRVFVGLVIVGGRRLRHLAYVADDPIFQRFGNVRVVPTARTLSRWLRHFTMRTVTRFQALNAAVVRQLLPTLGLRTWTVDVDGVVVSTGLQVERAARGYNPHQRKVPSYYPIMAHLAETTHILRVKNRSGNGEANRQAATNRVVVAEEPARRVGVDNHHLGRIGPVTLREPSSPDQRYAERLKIARRRRHGVHR